MEVASLDMLSDVIVYTAMAVMWGLGFLAGLKR
jgi:hypothetical protein